MVIRSVLVAGVAAICLLPYAANTQPLMQRVVSLRMAMTIAQTAMEECTPRVSVSVLDRSGRIEHSTDKPGPYCDLGQHRVKRMPQPGAVQHVLDLAARLSTRFKCPVQSLL